MTRKSRIRIAFMKRRVGQANQLRTVYADPVGWRAKMFSSKEGDGGGVS
jgi:hypothetical protein